MRPDVLLRWLLHVYAIASTFNHNFYLQNYSACRKSPSICVCRVGGIRIILGKSPSPNMYSTLNQCSEYIRHWTYPRWECETYEQWIFLYFSLVIYHQWWIFVLIVRKPMPRKPNYMERFRIFFSLIGKINTFKDELREFLFVKKNVQKYVA